jgi:hypothetical protein
MQPANIPWESLLPRRPKPKPDLRPDWRDSNMPVMLNCTDAVTGPYLKEFTPERAQYAFQIRMQMSHMPSWHSDPTYNLRKARRCVP